MIRPIPEGHGVGFFSMEKLPQYADKYREVNTGRYWNYHFTPECHDWPESTIAQKPMILDGFSPNLNKKLHVGHLRNLAIACSLCRIVPECKPVSIFGASQGVISPALAGLAKWTDFLDYHPAAHYDVLMPRDVLQDREATEEDEKHFPKDRSPVGCRVWDGPNGPVIVVRSDGRPTYAYYDLVFAQTVAPTHYLTGAEQEDHFCSLGLGDRHLGMGLVMGMDGKKMKSRTGDAPSAEEILEEIKGRLKETECDRDQLAWNILAWNFLHTGREKNIRYDPKGWTDPDAPGMYISYTYARMESALDHADSAVIFYPNAKEIMDDDLDLIGFANYEPYFRNRSISLMDPAPLANYAHQLSRKLGLAYHREKIKGGRLAFQCSIGYAVRQLRQIMLMLSMFAIKRI